VEGIFAREGEAGFRIRERSAVAALDEVTPPAGGPLPHSALVESLHLVAGRSLIRATVG